MIRRHQPVNKIPKRDEAVSRERWQEYTREKQRLQHLPPEQYEKAIRAMARWKGI